MENTALDTSNNPSGNGADPILNMYREAVDAWQKGYNDLAQASRPQQRQTNAALNPAAAYENTSAQLQKTGLHIFHRAIEQQIELGRFFGKRWEQYLDLSSDIAHCQSGDIAHIAQVQSAFLTKMAADYGNESRRLAQGFQKLLSSCMAAQPMSIIPK